MQIQENQGAPPDADRGSTELYAFPVPPMGSHETSFHSDHDLAAIDSYRKRSMASMDPPLFDTSGTNSEPYEMSQLEQENHCISQFRRFSKSTASLPIIPTHFANGGKMSRSSMEADVLNTARSIELESSGGYGAGTGKAKPTVRAVRSYHNLRSENNSPFSQSFFSLDGKDEPVPETLGCISPVKTTAQPYENNMETSSSSSGTITLVSYVYGQQPVPPDESGGHRVHQETGAQGCLSEQSLFAVPVPRRQYSMAQIEARLSNRNSMFVSDALFSGVASSASDTAEQPLDKSGCLARNQKQEKVTIDIPPQFNIDPRRTSRYLYNVPSGPFRSSIHGPLAKALQWPQRIGHNAPRRLRRTRSSVIDQHKIYDIYEEAVWHSTRTPQKNAASIVADVDVFSSSKSAASKPDSKNLSRSRILHKKASALGAFATTRLKSLGSTKSSGMSWNFIRSWKPRGETQEGPDDWYDPSSIPTDYADKIDDDDDDGSENGVDEPDSDISLFRTSASDAQGKKPVRKPSTIQMFVKRAGKGLLRRSASFYKSVSSTSTADSGKLNKSMLDTHGKYDLGISSADVCVGDSKRYTMRSRLTSAMRQASGKIRSPLKYLDKSSTSHHDEDADVVSAYPTDSMKGNELDSYLSLSALHSPVISSSEDSGTSDSQDMPASDETVCFDQEAVESLNRRYVPPKRPPYLGLHRKTARKSVIDCGARPLSAVSAESVQPTPPNMAAASLRLRPTQFNSPFMTLPYATYAQLSQTNGNQQQHDPRFGHT
ncbi:hypothetical protein EV178_000486 [Coemansia sp. RSA 1646]|nr:hypothetical protein EV178_000486 [Coemansia sp. RSA 1646]KAJ1773745.1 hypothetical protein LPJ74_000288 [Coemansia sp. RSA 1843]